jgi:hypothetical protein
VAARPAGVARLRPRTRWQRFLGLADHPFLDRVIRGRVWIGIVAFALIGIVAVQLMLLQLNSGIGRSLSQESVLGRENASLEQQISSLTASGRVEAQAARLGMVAALGMGPRFVTVHAGDARRARAALASGRFAPSTSAGGGTAGTATPGG